MNYILIALIIGQIVTLAIIIMGFLRLANVIAATTNALIERIGPISEITENIAGLPDDFDPFQHGIKQIILEKLQQAMKPQLNNEIKEYSRTNDGKFSSVVQDTSL